MVMPYDPDRTIGLDVCRTDDTRLSFIARKISRGTRGSGSGAEGYPQSELLVQPSPIDTGLALITLFLKRTGNLDDRSIELRDLRGNDS
jgi:hypothetical protein